MKSILLTFVLACAVLITNAQEIQPLVMKKTPGKNEIGFFGESTLGNTNNYSARIALQYKRWVKPDKAYRIFAGYSYYQKSAERLYLGHLSDTIYTSYQRKDIPMVFAGIGAEIQRHFYKKIYLSAAVDVHFAYGTGSDNTVTQIEKRNDNNVEYFIEKVANSGKAELFQTGITPWIGAKYLFNRISFGTELSVVQMDISALSINDARSSGGFNMDGGNLRQRIYFNYRF